MSPSRRGSVAGTLPKGRGCHATEVVAKSVALCHGLECASSRGGKPQETSCHGDATQDAANGATGNATALVREQLLPLAELIASAVVQARLENG
jgi:hypothetical protein